MDVDCCHVSEHFKDGTNDPDFLPFVGERGRVLVSGDAAMRKAHATVLAANNVKALFLAVLFANKDACY